MDLVRDVIKELQTLGWIEAGIRRCLDRLTFRSTGNMRAPSRGRVSLVEFDVARGVGDEGA